MKLAMSGTYENGSVIAVFNNRDQAEAWLEMMEKMISEEGLFLESKSIEEINTKFRAGVIFKKEQMEFDV